MERSRYRDDRSERSRYRQDSPVRNRHRSRSRSRDRNHDRDRDRDRSRNDRGRERRSPDKTMGRREDSDRRGERMAEISDRALFNEAIREQNQIQDNQHSNTNTTVADTKKDIKQSESVQASTLEEELDEGALKAMEAFMNEGEAEEDDEELERLMLERKKRREEILSKHNEQTKSQSQLQANKPAPAITSEAAVIEDVMEDSNIPFHIGRTAVAALRSEELGGADKNYEQDAFRQLEAEKSAIEAESAGKRYSTTFDIFSSSPSELERAPKKESGSDDAVLSINDTLRGSEDPHLQSNWDDSEGYYKARVGEVILSRYRTLGVVGKGVFSTVLKCADVTKPVATDSLTDTNAKPVIGPAIGGLVTESKFECVAIKMIRNNDTMRKAADKELAILTLLSKNDPTNKRHCVQLLERFEFRSHTALVFEYQPMNLREILKKFGKDVGINIGAIRLYTRQLLVALRYLLELRVVHADIKLDNILCSADLKQVKLCDFGSAFFETDPDCVPTPYLVSRFYRAPEIILGQQYDHAIDLWSVAVSAYELFTGHLLFPGRSNNEMLKLFMAVKGRFPNKQIRNHLRQYESMGLDPHFDVDLRFKQYEVDPVTGGTVRRLVEVTQPSRDLTSILRSAKAGGDDGQLVGAFAQLLELCLVLDPSKRLSVSDALKHPFFTGQK